MKMITVKDCEDLREKFEKYCETAEQHQFPLLLMIDIMMQKTMKEIRVSGEVENQEEAREMFRVVLMIIGEDSKEYQEESHGSE